MTDDANAMSEIERLIEDFELLDEWEDRYRYVIELGRELEPLEDAERNAETKVQGCASQVWLVTERDASTAGHSGPPVLRFRGDSDAHIVRGLIAMLLRIYSGHAADDIAGTDAISVLERIGIEDNLTPQRSNGLRSMVERIRKDAQAAIADAAVA